MSTEQFYGGRAWKRPLPVLTPPWGPEAPRLKRLSLAQGELAQFHDGDFGARYLAAIELRPGTQRGNHYHRSKREYVYVITGALRLRLEDVATGEYAALDVVAGDLAFIDAGLAHVLEPQAAGLAVEFSEEAFDPADTIKHAVREA